MARLFGALLGLVAFTACVQGHLDINRIPQSLQKNRYVIGLPLSNSEWLESEVLAISDPNSPRYGESLSEELIAARTAAPVEMRQKVVEWLKERGFSHIYDANDAIHFVADSEEHATSMLLPEGRQFLDTENRVPHPFLSDIGIVAIDGPGMASPSVIAERRQMQGQRKAKRSVSDPQFRGFVGRQTMEYLYDIDNNLVSPAHDSSSSICAAEYLNDQGYSVAGLGQAQERQAFPKNPIPANRTVGPNQGVNDESQLDVQIISAIVGDAAQWFWVSSGWLMALASEVYNHASPPNVVSNSWGWAADQQCRWVACGTGGDAGYVSRVDGEYKKLAGKRITFVAASGDAGAPGRTNEECLFTRGVVPIYPGSSAWITSVGGTYNSNSEGEVDLNKVTKPTPMCTTGSLPCANGTSEGTTNWDETFLSIQWTAGGGFAFEFQGKTPAYQKKFVSEWLASSAKRPKMFNTTTRAYPDVSANSNQCAVWDGEGDPTPGAGTSCATPIISALLALLNHDLAKLGKPLIGFANPGLYDIAEKKRAAYNKILPGNNACSEYQCCTPEDGHPLGYYSAKTRFDPVGGLGTPVFSEWRKYWTKIAQ